MSAAAPRPAQRAAKKPATVDQAPDSLQGYYAGFVSRAVAWIVDYAIIVLVTMIVSLALSLYFSAPSVQRYTQFLDRLLPGVQAFVDYLSSPPFVLLAGVVFFLLYFVFFFTTTGQTVGMALMGLRVVTMAGKRVGIRRAFVRTLCYPLSLAPFGLGYLWVLGTDKRQAWQDLIARTYVLYVWDAHYEENFLRNAVYRLTGPRKQRKDEKAKQ